MSSKNFEVGRKTTQKRRRMRERSNEFKEDNTSGDSCVILEGTEETDDPFRSLRVFNEKAKSMVTKEWTKACEVLANQLEESWTTIGELVREKCCVRCGDFVMRDLNRPAKLLGQSQCALQEYSRRYLLALRDLDSEREDKKKIASRGEEWEDRLHRLNEEKQEMEKEMEEFAAKSEDRERLRRRHERIKELETERDQLRAALEKEERTTTSEEWEERLRRLAEEKKEVELERDQLRVGLATRGGGGEDSSSSRGRHARGGRNEGGGFPPPSGDVIVPAILGALEK